MARKKTNPDTVVLDPLDPDFVVNSDSDESDILSVDAASMLDEGIEAVKNGKVSAVRLPRTSKEKRMTFDSYAKRKGIKQTHIPGLRAYTKNPNIPRTMAEWDAFFKNY